MNQSDYLYTGPFTALPAFIGIYAIRRLKSLALAIVKLGV
jgi:hypothetical protein